MERLYEFSNQLLMEENLHDVARHAPRVVASIFAFDAVILYLTESDTAYSSDPRRSLSRSMSCGPRRGCPTDRGRAGTEYVSFPWCWACGPVDRLP